MPAKRRDLLRFLKSAGCTVDKKAGKGSHMVVRRKGCSPYTLPHRDEYSDRYVKHCCQQLGLDYSQLIGRPKKKPKSKRPSSKK